MATRPGVVVEQFSAAPPLDFRSGVAGFVAAAVASGTPGAIPPPRAFTSWHDFAGAFRGAGAWLPDLWRPDELSWGAVQGFFHNGGRRCWIASTDPKSGDTLRALDAAVASLAAVDDVDVVSAPALMAAADPLPLQQQLIRSFEASGRRDWFLLLDLPPGVDGKLHVAGLRAAPCDHPENAALFYPWITVGADFDAAPGSARRQLPPSGHVAGVIARTDERVGAHKPPANEPVEGIVDVADADDLAGANPLRALPGRGIRVWGARTLAIPKSSLDPNAFINVRRLVLTLERWLIRALDWTVFEANDLRLWLRVERELDTKLGELFLQGAFAGASAGEAFSVKCDAENNPADERAAGRLHVDVQIAPAMAKEFIKIRVVRSAEGLALA